jgi:hypothetical protein
VPHLLASLFLALSAPRFSPASVRSLVVGSLFLCCCSLVQPADIWTSAKLADALLRAFIVGLLLTLQYPVDFASCPIDVMYEFTRFSGVELE